MIWIPNILLLFIAQLHVLEMHTEHTPYILTSSNRAIFRITGPLWGKLPVTVGFFSQRPLTQALVFSFICAWTKGWANNRDAADLRRHRVHHDATVMSACITYKHTGHTNKHIHIHTQPYTHAGIASFVNTELLIQYSLTPTDHLLYKINTVEWTDPSIMLLNT